MIVVDPSQRAQFAIGIDVGGTKIAAGLVLFPEGGVLARRLQPTRPERARKALIADVIEMAQSLKREAAELGVEPRAIGLGVAELVSLEGVVLSDATIRWRNFEAGEALHAATGLPVRLDADVRAAARGEAHLGAGRAYKSFLYVTVGTGISASLVIDQIPYAGARGLTGTFASSRGLIPSDCGRLAAGPPLEEFAAGPALAMRFGAARAGLHRDGFRRRRAGQGWRFARPGNSTVGRAGAWCRDRSTGQRARPRGGGRRWRLGNGAGAVP